MDWWKIWYLHPTGVMQDLWNNLLLHWFFYETHLLGCSQKVIDSSRVESWREKVARLKEFLPGRYINLSILPYLHLSLFKQFFQWVDKIFSHLAARTTIFQTEHIFLFIFHRYLIGSKTVQIQEAPSSNSSTNVQAMRYALESAFH